MPYIRPFPTDIKRRLETVTNATKTLHNSTPVFDKLAQTSAELKQKTYSNFIELLTLGKHIEAIKAVSPASPKELVQFLKLTDAKGKTLLHIMAENGYEEAIKPFFGRLVDFKEHIAEILKIKDTEGNLAIATFAKNDKPCAVCTILKILRGKENQTLYSVLMESMEKLCLHDRGRSATESAIEYLTKTPTNPISPEQKMALKRSYEAACKKAAQQK